MQPLSELIAEYWTRHNVTLHKVFASSSESLEYFHWRCDQYPGYLTLMPVSGFDGATILDFGCGPGDDLVGFKEFSRAAAIVGADVSSSSLAQAARRLQLHGGGIKLQQLSATESRLPFQNQSFDYVHSSGVIHHVADLNGVLLEFRRILKPGGRARVMIYNYNSVWLHLYVAYILRYRDNIIPPELGIREAFARSTDGPDCPIANCYTSTAFAREATNAGFSARAIGVACSLFEMQQLQQARYQACMDMRLEREHREFLLELTFDIRGTPLYRGIPAGVDLVMELRPA
jgi:ubiquinone/menaquinone biosynthesis C-methylase UbiE